MNKNTKGLNTLGIFNATREGLDLYGVFIRWAFDKVKA